MELMRAKGVTHGLFGGKVAGGGVSGTVTVPGRSDARPAFDRVISRHAKERGITPYVFEGSSMGADRFGVKTVQS